MAVLANEYTGAWAVGLGQVTWIVISKTNLAKNIFLRKKINILLLGCYFYFTMALCLTISELWPNLGIQNIKNDQGSSDYIDTRRMPPQIELNKASCQDWAFNTKPFDQSCMSGLHSLGFILYLLYVDSANKYHYYVV